jgi:hypothetical protein
MTDNTHYLCTPQQSAMQTEIIYQLMRAFGYVREVFQHSDIDCSKVLSREIGTKVRDISLMLVDRAANNLLAQVANMHPRDISIIPSALSDDPCFYQRMAFAHCQSKATEYTKILSPSSQSLSSATVRDFVDAHSIRTIFGLIAEFCENATNLVNAKTYGYGTGQLEPYSPHHLASICTDPEISGVLQVSKFLAGEPQTESQNGPNIIPFPR